MNGGMLQIVKGTVQLYARHLPALLAFFLAGWIANYLLIRFGGFVANIDPLYGYLVLPLAVLVRVASFVAMFLVLRPGKNFVEALGSSILPFLIVFATWGLIKTDWVAFASAQLEQRSLDGTEPPLFVTVTPITVGVVVVAFVLRLLLKRSSERLPKWFGFIAAYLEAVWIFLAIDLIGQVTGWVIEWLDGRRLVAWVNDTLTAIGETVAPLKFLWEGAGWLLGQAGVVIGLPLAWLTLAGIVYAVTRPEDSPTRLAAAAEKRLKRFPPFIRARLADIGGDLAGRWLPISQAARLIWRSGPITMALFVLSYAVLSTIATWIQFGVNRLIGPHDLNFWMATDTGILLAISLLVEPIRISLIAATWSYCLTLSPAGRAELQLEKDEVRQKVEPVEA
ncbi:hypothetical protein [Schumannella luteola]